LPSVSPSAYRGGVREIRIAVAIAGCAILALATGLAQGKHRHHKKAAPRGTVLSRSIIALGVATQPDGRIVTVGRRSGRRADAVFVARRLDNGQLDPTFRNGVVPVASKAFMYLAAIQPDGRILIAGGAPGAGESADGSPFDFVLVRLLQTGELDPSFGAGGVVRTDFGADDGPDAMTLEDDGKIILAGGADRGYPDRANPDSSFALARYLPDGSLDPSFGAGGKALITFGRFNEAFAVTVEANGKVAVAGENIIDPGSIQSANLAQARLLPNGSLDPSFGTGGKLVTAFLAPREDIDPFGAPYVISDLSYGADGRLVAVGEASVKPRKKRKRRMVSLTKVARYTVDGLPDPSFGVGGESLFGQRVIGRPTRAETGADGSIVVAGLSNELPEALQLVRVTPGGGLDAGFGKGGSVKTHLPGPVISAHALTFDRFGRPLVAALAGRTKELSVLARYQPFGRLDRSFGPRYKRHHPKHRRR
jgi:uncharacterized delta-60 repeat protein